MADGYIFGGDTGMSYEELKQRRAIATALAQQKHKLPQTFGEGLAYMGQVFGDALAERGLAQYERNLRVKEDEQLKRLTQPDAPAAPTASVPYNNVTTRPSAGGVTEGPPVPPLQPQPNISMAATRPNTGSIPAGMMGAVPQMQGGAPLLGHGAYDPATRITPAEVQGPAQPPAAPGERIPSSLQLARRTGIHGIESNVKGNPYQALGSVTEDGDRAYGKYQIMGKNIGDWTQAALGVRMTPQQFLADEKAQDDTFDHRMGMYAGKYGEEGAAKAWYAGEGGMNNPNATDQHRRLTTTTYGQDYLRRFNAALQGGAGGPQAAAPPEQADPRASLTAALAGGGAPIRLASAGGPAGTMSDAPPPGAGARPMPDVENPPTPTDIPATTPTPNARLAQNVTAPGFSMPGATVPWGGGAAAPAAAPAAPGSMPSQELIPPASEQTMAAPTDPGERPKPVPMGQRQQNMLAIMNSRTASDYAKEYAKRFYEIDEKARVLQETRQEADWVNKREAFEKAKIDYDKFVREAPERRIKQMVDRIGLEKTRAELEKAYYETGLPREQAAEKARLEIQQAIRTLNKPDTYAVGGTHLERPYAPPGTQPQAFKVPAGLPEPKEEPLTEAQSKAVQFVIRVKPDLDLLDNELRYGKVLTDPTEAARASIPIAGNIVMSPEYRRAANAVNNWGAAFLTQVSGAAVSPSEAGRNLPAFIPMAGDNDRDLLDKAQRRRTYTDALARTSGKAGMEQIQKEITYANDDYLYGKNFEKPAVRVKTPADAATLPPGQRFITPDGRELHVPKRKREP